jgi:hypothetical protein
MTPHEKKAQSKGNDATNQSQSTSPDIAAVYSLLCFFPC